MCDTGGMTMNELNEKEKAAMKEERLNQYQRQIFFLEMDVVALLSVDLTPEAEKKKEEIEKIKKAFDAVEAM